MHVSATSLAPDRPVRKATPGDNTERTARSGAVVETIFLSRPRRAQCTAGGAGGLQPIIHCVRSGLDKYCGAVANRPRRSECKVYIVPNEIQVPIMLSD